jgi:plasmid stabilization system protein ParE
MAANRIFADFLDLFLLIADQPRIGTQHEELRPELRSIPSGNYMIFYAIHSEDRNNASPPRRPGHRSHFQRLVTLKSRVHPSFPSKIHSTSRLPSIA